MAVDTPSIAVSMDGVRQQFTEQINFFRQKLNLPTERWDDIRMAAHDKAFIVAGAQKADLLADLRAAVDKAVSGQSIGEFRKDFAAAVAKSGWSGWTGEGTKAGEAWRTRVIYQTNIATSYAAGRWQQLKDPDLVAVRPFWQYIHSDSVVHPRPLHLAWGNSGLTLPNDHPFWKTHFPPNGWGCKCRVKAVRGPAKGAATAPPDGWDAVDPKTDAPVGIDKGWAYAPGANSNASFTQLVGQKLLNMDGPMGAVMANALKPTLLAETEKVWADLVTRTITSLKATGETAFVHTVAPETLADLASKGVVLDNVAIWIRDSDLLHAIRGSKAVRDAAVPTQVWLDLPKQLTTATPYLDKPNGTLIYVLKAVDRTDKLVIRVNYNAAGRFDGIKSNIRSNFVRTGGLVSPGDINPTDYELLKGGG